MTHPLMCALLVAVALGSVAAQDGAKGAVPGAPPKTFIERFDRRFAGEDPKVGAVVPAAMGYRIDGTEVTLHELLAPRTVIVSGCLT